MSSVIQVQGLTKKFGHHFTAVNDLSFSVNKGDVYGFLGQNGAGKSTTIRMLLSLITPTSGSIEIFGMPLQANRAAIMQNVGAVIEKPAMYEYLTAYQNLKIFSALSGVSKTRVQLLNELDVVGLAARAHDLVRTFSQGMKQRLAIAMAMVNDPQLILLDEPTNGLDPQGIADIRNLILQLSRVQGKTVLVSSHLLSEIEQVATRLIIIDKGCKLVEGDSKDLFDKSKTVVAIQTLNNIEATKQLMQTSWASHVLVDRSSYKEICMQLDEKLLPTLHKNLVEMGIGVLSVKPMHSLEDYFLRITSTPSYV
ncbi:MAG: ABC transporter ATP-binding protein [Bacteroidetes bacterium]|jgi:ABC-type multidrug transport system ATPase subunit|nr:ABC transporter ATP-binding protein [Bacteroidota bacterium]